MRSRWCSSRRYRQIGLLRLADSTSELDNVFRLTLCCRGDPVTQRQRVHWCKTYGRQYERENRRANGQTSVGCTWNVLFTIAFSSG